MKYFLTSFFLFLLFSCDDAKSVTSNKKINIRVFNFSNNKYEIFNSEKKLIKKDESFIYVYDFDKHKDTLKFIKNETYFKGQKLKTIDVKNVYFNGDLHTISKCLFESKRDFRGDKYLYINKELGLIFIENLFTGNMYEYDIKAYHFIHKQSCFK